MSLERTSNNLACGFQCFSCLFCARFALLKTGHSNQNLTKKGLKIKSFLQKTLKFFGCERFSLDTLNSEQKPSVKKTVNRAGQKPLDRPVNRR